jgi:hypothetical protein
VLRLVIGLLKGAIIGGAIGYGAYYLGMGGVFHWLTYGLVGAMVGFLAGRPVWSHLLDKSSTLWTAALKGIFGFGIGVGLYALASRFMGSYVLKLGDESHKLADWQFLLGGAIGAVYGAFVEVDDAPAKKKSDEGERKALPAKKRA